MGPAESAGARGAEQRGVLALLRALLDSGVDLAHSTVRMAASEGRIVLHRIAVRLGLFLAGMLVAAVGLVLGLAGATIGLARAAGLEPWIAFVAVGALTLGAGVLFALRTLTRISDADLAFPATLAEIGADIDAARQSELRRRPHAAAGADAQ